MSMRRLIWPLLVTLVGGWVAYTSPRTPSGFLGAVAWTGAIIFVWAYALWRRRG